MSIWISDVKHTQLEKLFCGVSTGHVFIMVDSVFNKGSVMEVTYSTCQKTFALKNAKTPKGLECPTFDVDTTVPDGGIDQVIDKATEWVSNETDKQRIRQILFEMKRNGEI